jgi:hypothetical protein
MTDENIISNEHRLGGVSEKSYTTHQVRDKLQRESVPEVVIPT